MVCGGSQGLGLASAVELSLLGANIILVSRNKEKLAKAIEALDVSANQQHQYLVADFSDTTAVKKMIDDSISANNIIHILVNNTGGPASGDIISAEPFAFEQAFKMHVSCNQILVQAVAEGMKKEKYGRIINIISLSVKCSTKTCCPTGLHPTILGTDISFPLCCSYYIRHWHGRGFSRNPFF